MKRIFTPQNIPFLATLSRVRVSTSRRALNFDSFFSARVFLNFLSDNAVLGVAAVGITFVILSGGIDLSVGRNRWRRQHRARGSWSMQRHLRPRSRFRSCLRLGASLWRGAWERFIHYYALPRIPRHARRDVLRARARVHDQNGVRCPSRTRRYRGCGDKYRSVALTNFRVCRSHVPCVPAIAIVIAHFTRFGRHVYALGGNEQAAVLMGLPVARTKVAVYAMSGFCSAAAGVVFTFYSQSGNATAGPGWSSMRSQPWSWAARC